MFFHFNLLCQKPAYFCFANTTAVFLPFLYCFLPLCLFPFAFGTFCFCILHFAVCYLWHIALCPLEVYSFAYSLLFHSLSFWGSLRSFAMPVCFNSDFLTFFILFFALCLLPFTFVANCSLSFGILPVVFLFSVVSFAVFWGSLRFFAISVCFNSRFLTFFILFFALCLFPFAFGTFRPLPFGISPFAVWAYCSLFFGSLLVFFILCCFIRCLLGQYSLFFNVCLFQQRFSYLFYIVFCPLPLSFAFGTFRPLPFSILQTAFCPLLPPFVVFFLFCVWNSPFALLLTAICCKNLLLDKKFSKNKKSLEIVIKTFDNT